MLFVLALVCLLFAPLQRPVDVVKWSVVPAATAVAPGTTVNLKVSADVQPGWKLYAIEQPHGGPKSLAFATTEPSAFQLASKRIVSPPSKVQKQDDNFAVSTHYYDGATVFTVPVTVSRSTAAGVHTVPLEVTFQACGKDICLRPFTQKLPVEVTVRP